MVDGYIWSNKNQIAGLRFKALINGTEVLLKGNDPVFTDNGKSSVKISWPLTNLKGSLEIQLSERALTIKLISKEKLEWFLDMSAAAGTKLPYGTIGSSRLECHFEGKDYSLCADRGTFSKPSKGPLFRINPDKDNISLNLSVMGR